MAAETPTPDTEPLDINSAALIQQSAAAATEYLAHAIRAVEAAFGPGTAATQPILVAAFVQAAATDALSNSLAFTIESVATALNDVSSTLAFINAGAPDDDDDAPVQKSEMQ